MTFYKKISSLKDKLWLVIDPDKYFCMAVNRSQNTLNYGCGNRLFADEDGVDISNNTLANLLLKDGAIPAKDESYDLVVSRYVLEHVENISDCIKDIHRVIKPGGIFMFIVPHCYSQDAFDDPTHINYFTLRTADYFSDRADVHYVEKGFSKVKCYLRLYMVYPRFILLRYPISFVLSTLSIAAPKFSEQLAKLPFMGASVIVEMTKD